MEKQTSTKDKVTTKDTQARKYLLTINNPLNDGLTHEKIKEIITTGLRSTIYYCIADEIGVENGTPHTHLFIQFRSPVRFSTVKNAFQNAHIDKSVGTAQENRSYVEKSGKWAKSDKKDTCIEGTFEEWGEIQSERQGNRSDLAQLYELIKDGWSDFELIDQNPDNIEHLKYIERVRQTILKEKVRNEFRNLEVCYIWGKTAVGKTRYVMEKYGYSNVFRVTDYKHPFDNYDPVSHNVLVFDEFCSNFPIQQMLNYLDGYPLELPCRYANKWANFTKVYIISNLSLYEQYDEIQSYHHDIWRAFLRRINKVHQFLGDGDVIDYQADDFIYKDEAKRKIKSSVNNFYDNKHKQLSILEDDEPF